MNKKLLSFVLLLTLGLTSLFAGNNGKFKERKDFNDFEKNKPAFGNGSQMGMNCENLNLSDEQKEEINKINEKFLEKRKELKKKMLDLKKESLDVSYDDYKGIKQIHHKKMEINNQMFDLSIDEKEEINKILTKEQKDKLKGNRNRIKF